MSLDTNTLHQLKKLINLNLGLTEQDVREDFIKPILEILGYQGGTENNIERDVPLKVPYRKLGTKKINISIFPDYILSISNIKKWVLDAKKSSESVLDEGHISQVYSYAIHK
jgi:hypothetical protein